VDVLPRTSLAVVHSRSRAFAVRRGSGLVRKLGFGVYLVALMLPIYWLINMSLRSNEEIMSTLAFWPHHPSLEKYFYIFNDPTWVHAFGVSLTYVAINTVISVTAALPAAYAFNRYHFIGDKYLFFWLLVEPDGAGGGLRHAVLQSLLCHRSVRHGLGGRLGTLPVQRAGGGLDSRGLRRRRAPRDRRDGGDRRLFIPPVLHPDFPAADRQRRRRHRVLSASCSRGWNNCWRRR
jgi:hypothetical protein